MGIGATYDLPLASGATLIFNLSAHYQDEFATASFPANYQGADSNGDPIIKQKQNTSSEERTLVDGYIKYIDQNERFEVTAYGKNLTDETWRNSAQPVSNLDVGWVRPSERNRGQGRFQFLASQAWLDLS